MSTDGQIPGFPASLAAEYTMGGKAKVLPWLFDDSDLDVSGNYAPAMARAYREKICRRGRNHYDMTDAYLYDAFAAHPLSGKSVLVFGSESPWYEIMAQEFGAAKVTVVEWNPRPASVDGISYVTPGVLGNREFDCALSISSFEHDGLGRYGDLLDPCGDLAAMIQAKRNVVHGGLLYLAVPVGEDAVVWNAHRVYGELRLPLLLQSWKRLASYGYADSDFGRKITDVTKSSWHQPVFVLENI